MPPLRPCPNCGRHVLSIEQECPHCHTSLRSGVQVSRTAAAAALGLALAACGGDKESTEPTTPTGQVDYGTSWTDTDTDTDSDTDTDTDTDTDSDTDADADTDTDADTDPTTGRTGDTGYTLQPDYGSGSY